MTRPEIEPWSPGQLANTVSTRTMDQYIYTYIYTYIYVHTYIIIFRMIMYLFTKQRVCVHFLLQKAYKINHMVRKQSKSKSNRKFIVEIFRNGL